MASADIRAGWTAPSAGLPGGGSVISNGAHGPASVKTTSCCGRFIMAKTVSSRLPAVLMAGGYFSEDFLIFEFQAAAALKFLMFPQPQVALGPLKAWCCVSRVLN
jgi:hypothetical protein